MARKKVDIDRRRHERFKTVNVLENLKIIKEKDKKGNVISFIVTVERGGHKERRRFPDMKRAFIFVSDYGQEDDARYDRKHRRVHSLNIISYECVDKEGNVVTRGIGKTLNISKGGILLETYVPIDTQYSILLSIDTEIELLMDVKAKAVYCRACEEGRFESGIEFVEPNETTCEIVDRHIAALNMQISGEEDKLPIKGKKEKMEKDEDKEEAAIDDEDKEDLSEEDEDKEEVPIEGEDKEALSEEDEDKE